MVDLAIVPAPFYFACILLIVAGAHAWNNRRLGWGIPACAVLVTVTVWYVMDVLYNDFEEYHESIGAEALAAAWWQVCGFVVAFMALTPSIASEFAGPLRPSQAMAIIERRPLDQPVAQRRIDLFAKSLLAAWVILMGVALFRIKFDFIGLFAPYLSRKVDPWARNRIGGGVDSILSLASYFQIFLTAGFGVILALSRNPRTRAIAFVVCLLGFPYYIFDRTRNTMLSTIIPGFSAWVFGRVAGSLTLKLCYIALGLFSTSIWFSFVLENRSHNSVSAAFASGTSVTDVADTKHLGLNMSEELSWINKYIADGSYEPNWGKRYFAEAVNPVPRVLWPEKPLIGIDYAIARGQSGGSSAEAGVFATVSTGLIGQGVINFGPILGPIAAALLMAIWVGILARHDRKGDNPARLMLYALGLILTFNMGRDITLLTLYPFIFGWIVIAYWEKQMYRKSLRR